MIWRRRARRRFRTKSEKRLVVLWWPSVDSPLPEVAGPYESIDTALAARDSIREQQARYERFAHVVPLNGGFAA